MAVVLGVIMIVSRIGLLVRWIVLIMMKGFASMFTGKQ